MSKFQPISFYKQSKKEYELLPFRFINLDHKKYLLTNMVGEYCYTDKATLHDLVQHKLDSTSQSYSNLRSRHFLVDDDTKIGKKLLGIKYRTRQQKLSNFTSFNIRVKFKFTQINSRAWNNFIIKIFNYVFIL